MPYQILYASRAAKPMTVDDLEAILAHARRRNEAREVTGVLLYVDGVFFQIVEGDRDVLRGLIAALAGDPRHDSVKVLYQGEVEARAFDSWRMAYLDATAEQLSQWAGFPGTATVEELLAVIDRDRDQAARTLSSILLVQKIRDEVRQSAQSA
jgi:hypothetical protein